jgi:dihydrofolate synthase/folylpolyglutamate synthase
VDIDATLKQFERFGIHLGLERMQQLLADLGNPDQQVPVIHVAGTNGKGSVCAYLSAVLTEAGYRVGRYTSPHLVDWTERICLNEQQISPEALQQSLLQVQAAIRPGASSPTQFEVITAAAWWYFAQQQVDVAVVEVGLGGRLDATNVCDRPLVSVITSLSREHWQRLGATLAEIAREKAGILKLGRPAVVGPLPVEARAVVEQRIADLDCLAVWPEPARFFIGQEGNALLPGGHDWAESQGVQYPLPLQGAIQLTNSALAIATLQLLRQQDWQISDAAIAAGMAKTQWPGRLQWTTWNNHQILLDGAHNPAAAQALRQFVDSLNPASTTWVIGMLSTKDHQDIFKALLRSRDSLYLVPVPEHSSAAPAELASLARQVCPDLVNCHAYLNLEAGLRAAIQTNIQAKRAGISSAPTDDLTVLCGSLYLVGHFLKQHQERP